MALPITFDEATTLTGGEAFAVAGCVPVIVYFALATKLRLLYGPGTIAMAFSVVVESIETGPVYRVEASVGVHPSIV